MTINGLDTTLAPLGVGCWAWGDSAVWGMGGYDTSLTEASIAEAFDASLAAGVTFFDTAEVYGNGESERLIGRLLQRDHNLRSKMVLATKFIPMPQKLNVSSALRQSLEASLGRLQVEQVDLYQIHGPVSLRSKAALAEALAEVHQAGLTSAVGVSNYSIKEMRTIYDELAKRGIPLATNQIEFSLLRLRPLASGLIDECMALGVTPLAYSPIGQGRLTGKYSASNPPPGKRTFSKYPMNEVDGLVAIIKRIGEAHGDKTPAQVALRWLIQHGAVPIPGAKNAGQAGQNAGALGWELTHEEMASLDAAGLPGGEGLFNRVFWQHG